VGCVCPACGWRPGIGEKHRWRSLAVHEATQHSGRRKGATIDLEAEPRKPKRLGE
jgi:hypothetical protein